MSNLTNETKLIIGVIVVTVILLFGGIFYLSKSSGPTIDPNEVVTIDTTKGQKIGSDSAKVKLVEFTDLQCPACLAAKPAVDSILDANYPDFQFIFRHFPLVQHKNAMAAARFAEFGAQNGKFWEVQDRLFQTQSEWDELSDPADFFAGIATELGLNPDEMKAAIKSNQYDAIIKADIDEGNQVGVNSTPTFYLNGKKIQDYSALKSMVESELQK